MRATQHGFTLIELLVGLAIVSILAATATQYFLHHRRKGWDAQTRASTRHMAGAQNYFVFADGAPAFTDDLDDLYLVGYRWDDSSVRPHVALATRETYCVQVSSVNDPSIVWHFSSTVGYPQAGPATPADCGDPEVLGTYIAGLPPAGGRDGIPGDHSSGTPVASTGGTHGDGEEASSGEPGGLDDATDATTTTGSVPGYGTSDPTSGTVPEGTGDTETPSTTPSGSCDGGTQGGDGSGSNHPSGKDRDTEQGNSGSQGSSGSDPDGDENGGSDKPGRGGGADSGDQDGNNGSGNDSDFEDDNRGPDRDDSSTPGSDC